MSKPEYVKVDGTLYKINTDFRVALKCNDVANDNAIGDHERAMAIIYLLFGEKGLDCQNMQKLLELGLKYLNPNEGQAQEENKDKYQLDYSKCESLIQSSFRYDYKYNPYELEYLHWYDFYSDLENLSCSELGSCCALSRIALILNKDPKKIKDRKERIEIIDLQKKLAEKYCIIKETALTEEQEKSAEEFYKLIMK